jgi:hypothetical protein
MKQQRDHKLMQQKTIKEIERLDGQAKILDQKIIDLKKQKEVICEKFNQNPPRIMKINDVTIQMRQKVLANDELNSLIQKYHIPIEDIALVEEWPEKNSYSSVWTATHPKVEPGDNRWTLMRAYHYGGPNDTLKALFRDCLNGRYVLTGFIFKSKFPEKQKRDWKSIFEAKRKIAA